MLTKEKLASCTDRQLLNMLVTTEQQISNPKNSTTDTERLEAELVVLAKLVEEKWGNK